MQEQSTYNLYMIHRIPHMEWLRLVNVPGPGVSGELQGGCGHVRAMRPSLSSSLRSLISVSSCRASTMSMLKIKDKLRNFSAVSFNTTYGPMEASRIYSSSKI